MLYSLVTGLDWFCFGDLLELAGLKRSLYTSFLSEALDAIGLFFSLCLELAGRGETRRRQTQRTSLLPKTSSSLQFDLPIRPKISLLKKQIKHQTTNIVDYNSIVAHSRGVYAFAEVSSSSMP